MVGSKERMGREIEKKKRERWARGRRGGGNGWKGDREEKGEKRKEEC